MPTCDGPQVHASGFCLSLTIASPPAGAAAGGAASSTVAQAAPRAVDPAFAGALPESYPWMRLAEQLMPAVVNVRTAGETRRSARTPNIPEPFRRFFPQPPQGPEGGEREPRPRGVGSGFIIDAEGYIVTNHHVVDGSKSIEVQLSDGRTFQPKVVGSDAETDLALLKIEATGLPMIPLGSSSALKVAEPVMAIGNPFGFDHTVTVGIVSGTGRFIGQGRFDDFIQTDAAINPGNSGGPLINTKGEAVGINSAIRSSSGGFQGIGFAIPVDLAKPILGQLRSTGKVTRGWLGVSIQPLTQELAKSFGITGSTQGALIASVSEDSPAARAGFKPGDVIVTFDGKTVEGPRTLPDDRRQHAGRARGPGRGPARREAADPPGHRGEPRRLAGGARHAGRERAGEPGHREARAGAPGADPGAREAARCSERQGRRRDRGEARLARRPGGPRAGRRDP